MQKAPIGIVIFILACGSLFAQGKIDWVTDYEEGLKKAKEEGKAIMLYFGSER